VSLSVVNGVELSWDRSGSGAPVLFCNGSGATVADAQPMVEPLAGEFDVLAFDYRGFGRSGAVTRPYTMADIAADVLGLLEHVGWDRCRVVGVSFGGMVAQEFAVTHPERVECLGLVCTSAGGDGGSSHPLQMLLELPAEERAAARLRLVDGRWDDRWLDAHHVDRMIAERLIARLHQQQDSFTAAAHQAQLEARAGHDVWNRLDAITCPTLVAYGRHDGIAPPQNSEAIASRIHGAELRGYEGGHMFLLQDPAAMRDLLAFLRHCPSPARPSVR
jgi:3-oxoadipate enol-lactonase